VRKKLPIGYVALAISMLAAELLCGFQHISDTLMYEYLRKERYRCCRKNAFNGGEIHREWISPWQASALARTNFARQRRRIASSFVVGFRSPQTKRNQTLLWL